MHILENDTLFTWLLPFVCLFLARIIYYSAKDLNDPWEVLIIKAMGFLYIIGEVLQYSLLGPGWLRWYVSDIGFVAVPIAWMLFFPAFNPKISWESSLKWAKLVTSVWFVTGCSLELFALQIQPEEPTPGTMVRGDVIDIMIFIVTYIITLGLLINLEQGIKEPRIAAEVPKPKKRKKGKKKRLFRP